MRVAHVSTDLQPLLHLIVNVQTSGVTLHVRVVYDTAILQVTSAGVVVQLVGHAAEADVILLTERVVESLVVPVIRCIVVLTVAVTQLGIGVQAQVGTHQVLTLWHCEDLVTQTTIVLVVDVPVSKVISLSGTLAIVDLRVVELLEVSLVVLTGISDHVVLRNQTAVRTPLGIELDLCLLVTTLLGGDQHNTVSTTCTVDGTGRSILQHGHRLYVVRVDRVQRTIVRHTIEHDQRAVTSRHRTDTTHADSG